jgi:hypothetical protein
MPSLFAVIVNVLEELDISLGGGCKVRGNRLLNVVGIQGETQI